MVQHATVTRGKGKTIGLRSANTGGTWLAACLRFCHKQPLGALGGGIVILMLIIAVLAPVLAPHGPKEANFEQYEPPSAEFPMGTDQLGRDMLSRVIWGARLSLYIGLLSVGIGVTLGSLWGIVTAYFGGAIDILSQRVVDSWMALPGIVLAISLMAVLGQAVGNVVVALAFLFIPISARIMRSTTLSIKESGYVEAARAIGGSHWQILQRHIMPNNIAPYIVLVSVNLGYAIVVEASLSFLGLGAPADEPSWGGMLTDSGDSLLSAPWLSLFPGAAITLAVFGMNMLGDAMRDVLDPKLRGQDGQNKH
ncbi:Glutathione transport system permease protein GsiD [Candidatus Entotheonellaceae bacterium PAL068K]